MFQLLLHPMLDDRTKARTDMDALKVRVWTPKSNRYGWSSYLGDGVAGPDVSPVRGRSPAARFSPVFPRPGSAWATHALFHDEDIEYARRLGDSGVPCDLDVVPGVSTASTWCFPRPRSRGSSGVGRRER
jgi:acetyl esterase/lipase